ncbi:MAG: hypothetical protein HEQ11_16005 [Gemmatimonas sp.]
MLHDVVANNTRALTTSGDATQPTPSRDGTRIAYLRDGNALHVVNADGTGDRKLASGPLWTRPLRRRARDCVEPRQPVGGVPVTRRPRLHQRLCRTVGRRRGTPGELSG